MPRAFKRENTVHQLMLDPTHLLPNSLSCTDLIFTDQANLAVDCDVHPSLHPNCHHKIIYYQFILMIEYPPQVWDYIRTDQNAKAKHLIKVTGIFKNL